MILVIISLFILRPGPGFVIIIKCLCLVPAFADDRLSICSKNQEAALTSLRQSYGAGYGKPIPGSASDKRGQEYQKAVTLEVMGLCRVIFTQVF